MTNLPCGICKIGDKLFLTRRHGENIAWMDRRYPRASTTEHVWLDQPKGGRGALAYIGTLVDRSAILVGKGPSVDRWLAEGRAWGPPEALLVTVNEAINLFGDEVDFAFAMDQAPLHRMADTQHLHTKTTYVLPQISPRHIQPPAEIASFVLGQMGTRPCEATAAVAIRFLALAGVRDIWGVGFDSIEQDVDPETGRAGGYSKRVLELGVHEVNMPSWEKINRDIRQACRQSGLEPRWYHLETARAEDPALALERGWA
jgi:hypothetical protein